MAERVASLGVREDRIRFIPNWADTDVIAPVPREENELRARHGLDGRFVVMYSGNMGVSHYFDDILDVAERMLDVPEVKFLFVGSGRRRREVVSAVERRGLKNVALLDYQPYELLAMSLSIGDVHFVSLRKGFEGLCVPSKAYGILAAGRPIVYQGSADGEIARMVEEKGLGAVMDQGDVDRLEASLRRAMHDTEWREAVGKRCREAAVGPYSAATSLAAYAEAFEEAARERL